MSFEKTVNKLAGLDAFMRREAKLITGEGYRDWETIFPF